MPGPAPQHATWRLWETVAVAPLGPMLLGGAACQLGHAGSVACSRNTDPGEQWATLRVG